MYPLRLLKLLKPAVVGGATGALLLVGSIAPAQACAPQVQNKLSVSSTLKSGYATVAISGKYLPTALRAKAAYGSKSTSAAFSINSAKTAGTASLNVKSLLPSTAGRYSVTFTATSVTKSATVTYTVGKAVTLRSVKASKTSSGAKITGKAVKNGKVKISVTFGGKTTTKIVKAGSCRCRSKTGQFRRRKSERLRAA